MQHAGRLHTIFCKLMCDERLSLSCSSVCLRVGEGEYEALLSFVSPFHLVSVITSPPSSRKGRSSLQVFLRMLSLFLSLLPFLALRPQRPGSR